MGDSTASADARTVRRRVVGHHVIWSVSAVAFVVAAWTTADADSAAPLLGPFAVATAWSAVAVGWSFAGGRVPSKKPARRGRPHPRSRRARGIERPAEVPDPPWRWPLVGAYAGATLVASAAAPWVVATSDRWLLLGIQPLALVLGGLSGICVALLGLVVWICVIGVIGFGRPLVHGEVDGEPVDRALYAGPFVATASLLVLPVVLAGPLAYDSPYRRDVLPLLGVMRDGVHVDHPVLLGAAQLGTWTIVLGLVVGRVVHGRAVRRHLSAEPEHQVGS